MSLHPIWKQQLTLVSYGNEFLQHDVPLSSFKTHSIFLQQLCAFKDLQQQHLLAQHFTVWLEGLKRQGCTRLSLHHAELLLDHANPNPNVELLAYSHFIVSHHGQQRYAWICGNELAEWYPYDHPFEPPVSQHHSLTETIFWRYALPPKLNAKIDEDLKAPKWAEIQSFLNERIFEHPLAQGLNIPMSGTPYMGIDKSICLDEQGQWLADVDYLPLIHSQHIADLAHQLLYQFDALEEKLAEEKQQQLDDTNVSDETRYALRNFSQSFEDLRIRCITKIANHHSTAKISQLIQESAQSTRTSPSESAKAPNSAKHTFGLIVVIVVICVLGYYFGL